MLGCLVTLAIIAFVIYFGIDVAGVYWRYYQYQDDMRQQMKYAPNRPNDAIIARLRAAADSLGLPDDARKIAIHRTAASVRVEAYYDEHVELPLFSHDFHLHPRAVGTP